VAQNSQNEKVHTAVCEVYLEQLEDVVNLHRYQRAFVVFRLRGAVVGQAWLPVVAGQITCAALRAALPAMALPIWQQLMAEESTSTQPLPTASIVVCTRDRAADLTNCLLGLQRLAEEGHEVIVVDSCPSDVSTARLVATYPQIRYLHEPRPGAGIARNRGLLAATREIVAFTDDDAQIDAGWLPVLLRNFADPLIAVVTGITMPLELETKAQLWFEQTNGFGRGFVRKEFDYTKIEPVAAGLVGASVNMAVRRSVVASTGLFDEALGPGTMTYSGEDHEFFYRVLANGYRIVYEPAALVWHRHRREWSALRQTLYGYSVGVFAWWTRALLIEGEWMLLKIAPSWFWQHHVRNLLRALLLRPGHISLDLALAELKGVLAGPGAYLRSRRLLTSQGSDSALDLMPASAKDQMSAPRVSQTVEA
jgi:GT2 family glycosyltransferase